MNEPATPSFEASLAELESVVRDLEDGSMSLEAALARYEQGVNLLHTCYERLQQAEQKIEELAGVDENGRPQLKPFEHATSLAKESTRRKASKNQDD